MDKMLYLKTKKESEITFLDSRLTNKPDRQYEHKYKVQSGS